MNNNINNNKTIIEKNKEEVKDTETFDKINFTLITYYNKLL